MKNLSLHILDIIQNSIRANSGLVEAGLYFQGDGNLNLIIKDDGFGMEEKQLEQVRNPFFSTRTTRRIGLGVSLLAQKAEQSGGSLVIQSSPDKGTELRAAFQTGNADCPPLGDIPECAWMLMASNPGIRLIFRLSAQDCLFEWDSLKIREALEGINLTECTVKTGLTEWFNGDFRTFKEHMVRL